MFLISDVVSRFGLLNLGLALPGLVVDLAVLGIELTVLAGNLAFSAVDLAAKPGDLADLGVAPALGVQKRSK